MLKILKIFIADAINAAVAAAQAAQNAAAASVEALFKLQTLVQQQQQQQQQPQAVPAPAPPVTGAVGAPVPAPAPAPAPPTGGSTFAVPGCKFNTHLTTKILLIFIHVPNNRALRFAVQPPPAPPPLAGLTTPSPEIGAVLVEFLPKLFLKVFLNA